MQRRTLLASLGGLAGTAGLTGCLTGPDGPGGTASPTPEPPTTDPPDSGDHPVTPAEQSFTVDDRGCGQRQPAAMVSFGDDSVAVEGVVGGRDGCDTARLASASLQGDELEVVVAVVREDTEGTIACVQCLTDIEYTYRASGLRGGPAQVRVVHESADGREMVTVADRS